jgi:succinylglutamate desuccinylase
MEGRIIGRYEGEEPGPLLICIAGVHGNEPAGLLAIDEIFRLLSIESDYNPGFRYKGRFVGIRGNLPAIHKEQRFIQRDLNRMLLQQEQERIKLIPEEQRSSEEAESIALVQAVESEIADYHPSATLILDLHTTTADGGIFTIAATDAMSSRLAKGLHAPVILGFEKGVAGTTLHFFNKPDDNKYCIVFEAGQHNDPESVHRTAAAIVNCMRTIGSVDSRDVDHRHDGILINMSKGLPKVTELIHHYRIQPGENFVMKAGFTNFQPLKKGDVLAENQNGPITAPMDGLMLMPKYQPQGDDGFFIVRVIE